MKEIVMLDQRIINLVQEVQAHPKLAARMKAAEDEGAKAHETIFYMKKDDDIPLIQSFEQGIGFLAAEVDILLHGDYSYEDICVLCDKIREKLIEKRTVILGNYEHKPKKLDRVVIQSDYKH